jgi:hypothetical protein
MAIPAKSSPAKNENGIRRSYEGRSTECYQYHEHQRRVDQAPGGPPKELAGDDLVDGQGRGDDRIEGLLVVHPHIRGVSTFKECGVHYGDGDQRRGDVPHVRNSIDLPDKSSKPVPDRKKIEDWLDERRKEIDLVCLEKNVPVPAPDLPCRIRDVITGVTHLPPSPSALFL